MLLVTLTGMVGTNLVRAPLASRAAATPAPERDSAATAEPRALGLMRRAVSPAGGQATSPDELRRRVANLSGGTYVGDILEQQDSALYRWPERLSDAVRVYVEPTSDVPGWDPALPQLARDVFGEWSLAGFPLRFAFVFDSAGADVVIRWRDRFPPEEGQRIGVTERLQTSDFLIARAHIAVALHDSSGHALPAEVVGGIVRHEVGHALGLNHASDRASVMYRETAVYEVSASDRATLRLLYLVPGGTLKN